MPFKFTLRDLTRTVLPKFSEYFYQSLGGKFSNFRVVVKVGINEGWQVNFLFPRHTMPFALSVLALNYLGVFSLCS